MRVAVRLLAKRRQCEMVFAAAQYQI